MKINVGTYELLHIIRMLGTIDSNTDINEIDRTDKYGRLINNTTFNLTFCSIFELTTALH